MDATVICYGLTTDWLRAISSQMGWLRRATGLAHKPKDNTMDNVIIHYDLPESSVNEIPTVIDVTIGQQQIRAYLSMCYWRPDSMTYHVEYRQMED